MRGREGGGGRGREGEGGGGREGKRGRGEGMGTHAQNLTHKFIAA